MVDINTYDGGVKYTNDANYRCNDVYIESRNCYWKTIEWLQIQYNR